MRDSYPHGLATTGLHRFVLTLPLSGLFDGVVVYGREQDLEKLPLVARWCRMLHDVGIVLQ